MSQSVEKRAHPRHTCNVQVTIVSDRFAWQGTILDVSDGGLFATSTLLPGVGSKLGFRFQHPQDASLVEVEGVIRRVVERAGTGTGKPGCGVEFVRLLSDASGKSSSERFVSAL